MQNDVGGEALLETILQVLERRLRLKPDPTIETLLQSLGAKVVLIDAPFEPEGGAYDAAVGDHGHDHHHHDGHHHHDHGHAHGHDHGHHDHAHDHGHHKHDHKHD